MNMGNMWFNYSPNCKIAINCMARYGHLFKWKDYKATVLEVGTGDGKITEGVLYPHLKNHVEKLVAVDRDSEMINFAKNHSRIGDIEYRLMDVMEEKTTKEFGNHFDKIFSFMVAPWYPDNRSLFVNMCKMLKEGGQIFVATVSDHFFRHSYIKQNKEGIWFKYLPSRQPFVDYTDKPLEHFQNLLQSAGFQVDFCQNDKEFYSVDNCKEWIRAVVHMTGDLKKIPVESWEDYVAYHYKNFCEKCIYLGEPDRHDVPTELMVGIATKITKSK